MPELTNALRKLVRSLGDAKARREHRLFVAEGTKCVSDTAGQFTCRYLLARPAWLEENSDVIGRMGDAEIILLPARR